jgi:hypothetical protein
MFLSFFFHEANLQSDPDPESDFFEFSASSNISEGEWMKKQIINFLRNGRIRKK